MTEAFDPAVPDVEWLEPDDLYLTRGEACEVDRPLFQGDVFIGVPLPVLPEELQEGAHAVEFAARAVMVIPHPCQCYHGDRLRPVLTVAPVHEVPNYGDFRPDRTGAKDKFALPDLPRSRADDTPITSVADFGNLVTIASYNLRTTERIACLSHQGLGLLAKRVLGFQLRCPTTLANAMNFTAGEWSESFLMQAWIRRNRSLTGFTAWLRDPTVIPGVNNGEPIAPNEVREGALGELLDLIEAD